MKKINIELFFQKPKSIDCGPVSVRMILKYFGIDKTEDELKEGMTFGDAGSYIYDNGLLILKEGLKVELVTANPLPFSKESRNGLRGREKILAYLTKISKKNPKLDKPLSLFKKFIIDGGSVKIEIPTLKHVKDSIDKKKPVLALVYGRALGKDEGGFHFVIVSGYKKGFVYINNPLKNSRQGWFREDDFLYSLYASTCADVDNGSLLIVSK